MIARSPVTRHPGSANLPPMPACEPSDSAPLTPVMARYIELKTANPGFLLFYRMGDFYELFFDDAVMAAGALGIALTKRGQYRGQDIPMAGVPAHAADDYLHRLIDKGYRVAICEQMEDPAEAKKRGSKAIVHRDVVRLVTAGTLTEDRLLVASEANYLLALARTFEGGSQAPARLGLAWIDMSTGEFRVGMCELNVLQGEIARIAPREIIAPPALIEDLTLRRLLSESGAVVTALSKSIDDTTPSGERLAAFFGTAAAADFDNLSRAETAAAANILAYLDATQLGVRPRLSLPQREGPGTFLDIDASARVNLELTRTLAGERAGSLLSAIDCTVTAAGSRELARRLSAPLTDPQMIIERQEAVAYLCRDPIIRERLRQALAPLSDLLRALGRLALGRGGPRDLAALRDGLTKARDIAALIHHATLPSLLAQSIRDLGAPSPALAEKLTAMLADELPLSRRDGGFVRAAFDPALDEERRLRDDARGLMLGLQATYAEATGIRNLRIKHNNVLGYFIEISAAAADRMFAPPLNADFFHRQTLASQARFTTTALSDLESRIARAAERALALEQQAFEAMSAEIAGADDAIRKVAIALAALDVESALAELAAIHGWTRPVVDHSLAFAIRGGRHPVVEAALKKTSGGAFIANDCTLGPADEAGDAGAVWLLTGPNMAGKSTFLRQNALIAILAQMGSFVPATMAHIGIVDRLYSRVGAADDLARGRSTFMVEMVETAVILNQATNRSLVILDEIGRGTATFDGLSIAWATIEHIHEANRCRTLFATHFHELTALGARLARLTPVTMKVKEWKGDVVFLHEVGRGTADRSYGIQVAKLAGLPASVIARARTVLSKLEEGERAPKVETLIDDLPLFSVSRQAPVEAARHQPLLEAMIGLDPDAMTPREAHEALYRLIELLRSAQA